MRRGFTLLEVVAATVLLTMIVATAVPFLRSARVGLAAATRPVSFSGQTVLEAAVDDLLLQRPGLITECLARPDGLPVEWVSGARGYLAEVRLLPIIHAVADERRTTHSWAVFTLEGTEIIRWVRVRSRPTNSRGAP
ncbi:MAG: type II secretion system protein [Phycisphaerales bacterium JB041]